MGKATITENLGEGKYLVEIDFRTGRLEVKKQALEEKIVELTAEIAAETDPKKKERLELSLLNTEKQLNQVNAFIPGTTETSVWCLDYTNDIPVGTVIGTVEVPGERRQGLNVQAGWKDGADGNEIYNQDRDGQIQPVASNTRSGAFLNVCRLAGWQKWKPVSRYGRISSIDYDRDRCTVVLDAALSSAQSIPINQESILRNVPIDYMYCNDVLEINDRVCVLFTDQDWKKPVVRGFESNPKQCIWEPWNGPNGNQNHPWDLQIYDTGGPAVLVQPWNTSSETGPAGSVIKIENGILKMSCHGAPPPDPSGFNNNYLYLRASSTYNIPVPAGIMEFKIDTASSPGVSNNNTFILQAQDNSNVYINITGSSDETWQTWPGTIINATGFPVPTSTSGTFQVDLGAAGVPLPLKRFTIANWSGSADAYMEIDYINFK